MKKYLHDNIHLQDKFFSELIQDFQPVVLSAKRFVLDAKSQKEAIPILIGTERSDNSITHFETVVCTHTPSWLKRSKNYLERIIKFLLWSYGASTVYIGGSLELADYIKSVYSINGARKFDVDFMTQIFGTPFSVTGCSIDEIPKQWQNTKTLGHQLDGYRVGFDLGASEVKVSAVIEGETVFSTELEWFPTDQCDPEYHKSFIRKAIKLAASKLPRLDAIGGSAAGVYINNQPRIASLFRGVPEENYERVHQLFNQLAAEFGVPMVVINDGEVTALAGAISLEDTGVMGLALGSSEAIGYINSDGKITGYLNELAFAPIDISPNAPIDEWSGDRGVGASYLSQQAVFRLSKAIGIDVPEDLSPAARLELLQEHLEAGHPGAEKIWNNIGIFLGYAVAHYATFYEFKHLLILGRVTSGSGGSIIQEKALEVLTVDFPALAQKINLQLPDEKSRRVGQAIAAASLPIIER
jgi:predicted NBD/HSP70 family sugar kinase